MLLTIKYETDGYGNFFHSPLSMFAKAIRVVGAVPTNASSAYFGYKLGINEVEYWISRASNSIIPVYDVIKNITCKMVLYPDSGIFNVWYATFEIFEDEPEKILSQYKSMNRKIMTIKYEPDGYGGYFHTPLSIYAKAVRIIGVLNSFGNNGFLGYKLTINNKDYWIGLESNTIIPVNEVIKTIGCRIYINQPTQDNLIGAYALFLTMEIFN